MGCSSEGKLRERLKLIEKKLSERLIASASYANRVEILDAYRLNFNLIHEFLKERRLSERNKQVVLAQLKEKQPRIPATLLIVQFLRQKIRRKAPGRFGQDRVVAVTVGHGESMANAVEEMPIQRLAVRLQTRH